MGVEDSRAFFRDELPILIAERQQNLTRDVLKAIVEPPKKVASYKNGLGEIILHLESKDHQT